MTLWPFQNVVCHSQPYVRSFVAQRCSAAYFLHLLCLAALVLLPLYAGLSSDGTWVKESSYREQPLVRFTHELLVAVSDSEGNAVSWSTRQDFDSMLPGRTKVPLVRSTPHDDNHDGVPDTWELLVRMPTGDVRRGYQRVFLLAAYDFELREKVREKIGGMVVVDLSSGTPATGVWLRGALTMRQSLPLRVTSDVRDVYARNPLVIDWASNAALRHQPLTARSLLAEYAARNESVYLERALPPVWSYEPREYFDVHLVMDVPPLSVAYMPGAVAVLKVLWVQLLALGVPVWAALRALKAFAFDNQIVESYVVAGLPPKHIM